MAITFQRCMLEKMEKRLGAIPQPYRIPVISTACAILLISPFVLKTYKYVPKLLPPPPKDYKYRLAAHVEDSSSVLTLADGRDLGYAEFGDLEGRPIFVLHGILGSRLENALFDINAKELNARIIGVDRPGIGLSSPYLKPPKLRTLFDHAHDVEELAKHLQLKEYGVVGMSGGGPYALACAHLSHSPTLEPTLKAVAIVTGQGLADMSQSWPRLLVFLNKQLNLRWLLKRVFGGAPEWQMDLSDDKRREIVRLNFDLKKAHPADIAVAKDPTYPDMLQVFLRSSRQAIAQGWEGCLDDAAVISGEPGFRVEDIRADLPVQLWYGTDDRNISPQAGVETHARLRAGGNMKAELHMELGETHGSVQVKYQRRVLKDLLKTMNS